MSLRFVLESRALAANNPVGNLGPLDCRRNPGVHDRSCRRAGGGAQDNGGDSHPTAGRKLRWAASNLSHWQFPSSFCSPASAPACAGCATDLRPPLVLDGHALRLCLSGYGRADCAAFRLLCRLYPAACRWMVAPDLAELAEGRRRATCGQPGPRIAANLASVSVDRQKPATLVALLRSALVPFAFLAMVALPVWVAPLTTSYKPLSDHALEMRIKSLAARCGVALFLCLWVATTRRLSDWSDQSHRSAERPGAGRNARANRIHRRSRIEALRHGRQLESAGDHRGHPAGGILAYRPPGPRAIRRFSGRWGFWELSDPASFPLMVFMFTFIGIAILPFFNLFARHIELEADRFGLELTHQNHAAATIFAKDVQSGYLRPIGIVFS